MIDEEQKLEREEVDKTLTTQPLNNKVDFNSFGIFFFVPQNFEVQSVFGETKQQQVLTILNLFQKGILVEGFYKIISMDNGG